MGDQLTCKNIRSAKVWRIPEINPVHQMKWAHEVPGTCVLIKWSNVILVTMYSYLTLNNSTRIIQVIFTSCGSASEYFWTHFGET